MSIYAFEKGPSYRPMTALDAWDSALSQPYSLGNNLVQQGTGGVLESFGLGTAVRDTFIPQGNTEDGLGRMAAAAVPGVGPVYEGFRALVQSQINDNQPDMSEDDYKKSAWYRPNIPFEPGMTQQRAEALATWDDARKVREHFASKRPISSFIGNLGGQALDPINYVPVFGNLVKAAAVGNVGRIAGTALVAAGDAAANTALAAIPTMDARGQYGDDVSWQTTVSQIATAALIGGAFGGIGGALGKGLDARAKSQAVDSLGTLKTVQEARIALNEGIDALMRGEDINLSPNATEPMARVLKETQTKVLSSANEVDRSWAGQTDLGPQTVVTPTGLRVAVKSEVVDALSLIKASGDLQPRDRSRASSDAQIAEMAGNLDPARLMFSPEADRGAPIVGPDGIVESGNGRVAALVRAAAENPERFAAYKQALRDAGYDVPDSGIPILVSRRTSDLTGPQRAQFVNDANTSSIARMSATEVAQMDTRAMTGAALNNYVPGDVNSSANRAFVGTFMRNLPANERLGLIDADGRLNADGVRRVENALIATAYGDADVVARFAESTDDNVKSIMGAMVDASGEWASMRRDIAEGIIGSEHDVTANLTNALRFLSMARDKAAAEKRPVSALIKESLGQIDLLAGDIDPRTKAFIQSFYKNDQFTQANGRDIMAEHLVNITRAARELGRPSLFGDAINVAPSEMIANARPQDRQADIFGAGGSREGSGANGEVGQIGTLPRDSQASGQSTSDKIEKADFNQLVADAKQRVAEKNAITNFLSESGQTSIRLESKNGMAALVGPNTIAGEEPFRVTLFGKDGIPLGHRTFQSLRSAIKDAVDDGYRPKVESRPLDTSPARPEPLPEGRAQAEARVAKAETYKQTAETYRVDPETGDFPELADIAQIEKEGRLTEADMAALETAKLGQENGVSYGEALKAVVNCLI